MADIRGRETESLRRRTREREQLLADVRQLRPIRGGAEHGCPPIRRADILRGLQRDPTRLGTARVVR